MGLLTIETELRLSAYDHFPIRSADPSSPSAFITLLWHQSTFWEHNHLLMHNELGPKFGARFLSYLINSDNVDEVLVAFLDDCPAALVDLQECMIRLSWHRDTLVIPTPDGEMSLFQHAERFIGVENMPYLWQTAIRIDYPPARRHSALLVLGQSIYALVNGLRIIDHYDMGIIATSTGVPPLSRGHVEKADIICNMHGYDFIAVLRKWLDGYRYVGETSKKVGHGYCWDNAFEQGPISWWTFETIEMSSYGENEAVIHEERRFNIL